MTVDLPIIPSPKERKKHKVDSSIPKWTVFSLCIITVLIVVAITNAILPLLFFGLVLAFIWSQATKPVAQFEKEVKHGGKQLNLFYQNESSAKYLSDRSINRKEKRAA